MKIEVERVNRNGRKRRKFVSLKLSFHAVAGKPGICHCVVWKPHLIQFHRNSKLKTQRYNKVNYFIGSGEELCRARSDNHMN